MIIRYAKEEDLPMLVEIYNQSVQTSAATFDLTPVTVEQRRSWFNNHISNELFPLIVAEKDGVVAGYASLSSYRDKEAYIQTVELSIYIDKNQQGHGIGKQLMKRILELAKELNHHVVISGITKGNDISIKMHEQFNFTFCGEFKEVGWKFDQWQDVLFYQLIL
ncbi:N-acetyltransferase family protein [Priestia megaterium]|uniref:N-acetyltransferase n=1 Tax=Priestia megaterium TaxID=1404 RepID=A0A3D8X874_PRIMG|nr:GNAT family N-acetyltransferase [Priestia megaterium]MDC7721839.1 GNAT family N-acetyltransferase [Priestia megaterium]MDH3170371.1 GNAT family N-acetyltransferase [Priestia megaterium]MEB2292180.1 GNAT family N-acetyltransferase [Priestia megaterium]MEE3894721.1 N-acetyltransferase family protein [Priestia megaterium]MQR85847.1 GNAT family N-acetyltransferase [Priestia megaterium]